MIYEQCINVFFDTIKYNFSQVPLRYDKGSISSMGSIGIYYALRYVYEHEIESGVNIWTPPAEYLKKYRANIGAIEIT